MPADLKQRARILTIAGLTMGAVGIAILWAAGVEFPFYPPPGILILGGGAVFVALAPWRWAAGVGAVLGLFVLVGFVLSSVISGTGTENLLGEQGPWAVVGTVVQLLGVSTALVAGLMAARRTEPAAHAVRDMSAHVWRGSRDNLSEDDPG
jgi:hypothetical protein